VPAATRRDPVRAVDGGLEQLLQLHPLRRRRAGGEAGQPGPRWGTYEAAGGRRMANAGPTGRKKGFVADEEWAGGGAVRVVPSEMDGMRKTGQSMLIRTGPPSGW